MPHIAGQDDDNAADHYRKAIDHYESLDEETIRVIVDYANGDNSRITPDIDRALREVRPMIEAIQAGAQIEHIDWRIDYSQGANTLLPHLQPMRTATQIIAAESRRAIEAGDSDTAAAMLAAGMRMADHTSSEPVLITSLISMSQVALIDRQVQQSIDRGQLSQADAKTVLEAADAMLADDPFGYFEAGMNEQKVMVDWLRDEFVGEGGLERFREDGVMEDMSYRDLFETQEEFDVAVAGLDLAMDEMLSAMQQDDLQLSIAALERLEKDIEAGVFGPLSAFLPAMGRSLQTYVSRVERLEEMIDALETVAESPDGAASLMNAAVWYWQAIEQHGLLTEEQWEIVHAFIDQPNQPITPALREAVEVGQPIVNTLQEAIAIERCRFDLTHSWQRLGLQVQLDHLPGMRNNAALWAADVVCRWRTDQDNALPSDAREEDSQTPAERLAGLLQMVSHLTTDKQMPSVMIAGEIGNVFDQTVQRLADEIVERENRPELRNAVKAMLQREMLPARTALFSYRDFATERLVEQSQNNDGTFHRESFMSIFAHWRGTADLPALFRFVETHDDASVLEELRKCDRLIEQWQEHVRTGNGVLTFEPGMGSSPRAVSQSLIALPFRSWLIQPVADAARSWQATQSRLQDLRDGILAD